jgi:hypothetical protein
MMKLHQAMALNARRITALRHRLCLVDLPSHKLILDRRSIRREMKRLTEQDFSGELEKSIHRRILLLQLTEGAICEELDLRFTDADRDQRVRGYGCT